MGCVGRPGRGHWRVGCGAAALVLCFSSAGDPAPRAALAAVPGEFTAPRFAKPETRRPGPGTRVNVIADRIAYDGKRRIATATGSVRITYGPYTLVATKVVYDLNRDLLKANGSVQLREPNGNILEADYAEITERFREGFAAHVRALLTNDAIVTADYARRSEGNITVYERATYTACIACVAADATPLWQIVAREATHDQAAKTIYYRDMHFEIGGVPVLWLPYLAYPDPTVGRRTGFLFPQLSYGKAYGAALTTPYFWAPAPNYDMTLAPRWNTRQSPLADAEWRHRLAQGMYDLHAYGIYQLTPGATDDGSRLRGALTSRGEFRIDDVWTWGWDGTLVSDRQFLDDYEIDDRDLASSDVHAVGIAGRSYAAARALHFQSLLREENDEVWPNVHPYVTASHTYDQPVLGGELGFDVSAYSLSRDAAVDAAASPAGSDFDLGTEQTRGVVNLRWQRQMIAGMGQVITPFAGLRGDVFVSEHVPSASSTSETDAHLLPSAGLDVRWPFIAGHGAGQSVLTPVVQVIAAGSEKQDREYGNEDAITLNFDHSNLFLQDRFSGLDRYEGGTRANAGVTYAFLDSAGGFARVSLGESFHIAGTNSFVAGSGLDGTASDLVGAFAYQPNEMLRFTYQARVEEDLSRVNAQEAAVSLTFDRISGSLSFADIGEAEAYGRPSDEEQVWGDASYRLGEAWSVFGGFRYDLRGDRFMDKAVGVLFECDCMRASLVFSEGVDEDASETGTDRRIKLTVEFRTLGAVAGGFEL
jgi:LPS-assembly protein